MTRKEYIEKLDVIRAAILNLHAEFTKAKITDENPIEEKRRKAAGGLFDKLNTQLYENGAVSLRIMDDNANAGIGEQCDLFDEARRESAENGDQGETEDLTELLDGDHGDDLPPEEIGAGATAKKNRKGKKGRK